jgi:hypothetical protein
LGNRAPTGGDSKNTYVPNGGTEELPNPSERKEVLTATRILFSFGGRFGDDARTAFGTEATVAVNQTKKGKAGIERQHVFDAIVPLEMLKTLIPLGEDGSTGELVQLTGEVYEGGI